MKRASILLLVTFLLAGCLTSTPAEPTPDPVPPAPASFVSIEPTMHTLGTITTGLIVTYNAATTVRVWAQDQDGRLVGEATSQYSTERQLTVWIGPYLDSTDTVHIDLYLQPSTADAPSIHRAIDLTPANVTLAAPPTYATTPDGQNLDTVFVNLTNPGDLPITLDRAWVDGILVDGYGSEYPPLGPRETRTAKLDVADHRRQSFHGAENTTIELRFGTGQHLVLAE